MTTCLRLKLNPFWVNLRIPNPNPYPSLLRYADTIYTYHNNSSEVTIIFKNDLVKEKHGTFGQ